MLGDLVRSLTEKTKWTQESKVKDDGENLDEKSNMGGMKRIVWIIWVSERSPGWKYLWSHLEHSIHTPRRG